MLWNTQCLKTGVDLVRDDDVDSLSDEEIREAVTPALARLLQAERPRILFGSGLSIALCRAADVAPTTMAFPDTEGDVDDQGVRASATRLALASGREEPNLEDYLHAAESIRDGLLALDPESNAGLELSRHVERIFESLAADIVRQESDFINAGSEKRDSSLALLERLLQALGSKSVAQDRLHIFTTNYDRFIEYALDRSGMRTLDRFVGTVRAILRSSRPEVDYHYLDDSGRGEPRRLNGVVRYTKLHGSIDWRDDSGSVIRTGTEFAKSMTSTGQRLLIYPRASKEIESVGYPYVDLIRDFSSSICRPESVLITYGYGFADGHINRAISEMLTLRSTHLVVVSYDAAGGRIAKFVEASASPSQVTLLVGNRLGDLATLVNQFLPANTDSVPTGWNVADV